MTAVPAPPPAPAPEAATPDPAAMEAALAEAFKGMRVSVTVDAIEATAGTVTYPAQLAAMLWPALAPAWDALAARLAGAEAERDRLAGQVEWRDALLTAVTRVIGRYEDEELNAITAFAEVVAIIAPDAGPGAGGARDAGKPGLTGTRTCPTSPR